MSTSREVSIEDVEHVHICGDKSLYCAHPRQGGLWNFGGGELAVIHHHAPWPYAERHPMHGFGSGYKSKCVWMLNRSTDGGRTWPEENNVVVYDETMPFDEKRAFLHHDAAERDVIDLGAPDSMVVFGRTWLGETAGGEATEVFGALGKDGAAPVDCEAPNPDKCLTTCFALRSGDRGRTWESFPTVIGGPVKRRCEIIGYSTAPMPDGSMIMTASIHPPSCCAIYGSDDDGLSWEFLSVAGQVTTPLGGMTYPGLVTLPDGRVQCYMLEICGTTHSIVMSESDDCYNWTKPRSILRWGHSPWRAHIVPGAQPGTDPFPSHVLYRSPWPLRLEDGRILVVFGRRRPPYGIGAVLSEDDGATWSDEFIIRDDASGTDLGYCLATEVEPGRIFAAYYFMVEDGNPHGGSRYVAGSLFSV